MAIRRPRRILNYFIIQLSKSTKVNIYKLRNTNRSQVESRREMEEELVHHFKGIMMEDQGDRS